MAYENAASIAGVALRVTLLNADGTKQIGPSASYVTNQFVDLGITPEYEAGGEFVQKGADGSAMISFKSPDTLKRVNTTLTLVDPNPELTQMLAGGQLLSQTGVSVGYNSPKVGEVATPNGVAIEVWAKAIVNGRLASTNPYWMWVLPYVQVTSTGERKIADGILGTTFTGWGLGNSSFVSPGTPTWAFGTDRPYGYARVASLPTFPGSGWGYAASS
jgi:hypothetical protein